MEHGPNIIDIVLMVILALFLIRAFVRGFVREALGLIGVIVAILVSALTYQAIGGFLERVSGMPGDYWYAVGYGITLVAVFVLFVYFGRVLSKLLQAGPFSAIDRLLGAGIGLVKGILVSYLLLNIISLASPFQKPEVLSQSYLTPYVAKAGNYIVDLVPDSFTQTLKQRAREQVEKHRGSLSDPSKGQSKTK